MMHTVSPYDKGWKAFVFKLVHFTMFFFCKHVFVHTEGAKKKLLSRSWIKPKVDVVPIAIDAQAVPKLATGKKLLSFGFISSDKGLDILCKAVHGLHVDVTIAGSVSPYAMKKQHAFLKNLEKDCSAENITLINKFVSEEEKEKLFKETDYFVLPYRFIEQSAVLTEVWGYGKIPICSDIPGFKEEIGTENGVLFRDGDSESLRGVIENIISNKRKQQKILDSIKKLQKERSFNVCAKKVVDLL
jgi:glycosyltransferase involved in cell wall biosynthesis